MVDAFSFNDYIVPIPAVDKCKKLHGKDITTKLPLSVCNVLRRD